MASQTSSKKPRGQKALEGEGGYSAARDYNRNLGRALADKQSIQRGADRARQAVQGPEGPALRAAEKKAKAGPRSPSKRP
jgi:hypothetical protein